MTANLDRTGGLFFSEAVLLALVKTGLPRQEAYVMVQRNALTAISEAASMGHIGALPGRFRELLGQDPDVTTRLDAATLDACFDLDHHLRHAPEILERALGGQSPMTRPRRRAARAARADARRHAVARRSAAARCRATTARSATASSTPSAASASSSSPID